MRGRFSRAAAIGVTALGIASLARAGAPVVGPHDVVSLFSITKSQNKNEVVFGIHLDEHCAPVGDAPIFEFWRMLEGGPVRVEPLLDREQAAYGIQSQAVLARSSGGGRVQLTLKALPARPIVIETARVAQTCKGWSVVPIAGTPAYLYDVHAKLSWPFGIDYLLVSGWSADRTHVVTERIDR